MSRKQLKRKYLVTLLAIVMIVGLIPVGAFGAEVTDIEGHWAQSRIQRWLDQGLADGYPDGTFQPNGEVTRAEFVAFMTRAFQVADSAQDPGFTDVNEGDWYYNNVATATAAGLIEGYPDGTFGPNLSISRQEAATILYRLLDLPVMHDVTFSVTDDRERPLEGATVEINNLSAETDEDGQAFFADFSTGGYDYNVGLQNYTSAEDRLIVGADLTRLLDPFVDQDQIAGWAETAVNTMAAARIVIGYPDGTFRPNNSITRAESITMMDRGLSLLGPVLEEVVLYPIQESDPIDYIGGPVDPRPDPAPEPGERYELTMATVGSGTATDVTDASPYLEGEVVDIEAVAEEGFVFLQWTTDPPGVGAFGNVSEPVTTFTMPAQDVLVTAVFYDIGSVDFRSRVWTHPCFEWSARQDGRVGTTIDTWDISEVQDGAVIDFQFDALTVPDRYVIEYDGQVVLDTGWRGSSGYDSDPLYPGGIAGPGAGQVDEVFTKVAGVDEFKVTVYAPASGTIWYYWLQCRTALYDLTINVDGQGTTAPAAGTYQYGSGTIVEVTATPATDWYFVGWTGDATGTNPTINVTMDADKTITAVFAEIPPDTYAVDFEVSDADDASAIAGAAVSVYADAARTLQRGTTRTTDGAGEATLDVELEDGTYYYTVTAMGYTPAEGDFTVAGAPVTVQVELDAVVPDTYAVDFEVSDADDASAIAGAEVSVYAEAARTTQLGSTLTTDGSGEATLDVELLDGTYYYTVTASGYETAEGDFTVAGANITVQVEMDAVVLPSAPVSDLYRDTAQAIYDGQIWNGVEQVVPGVYNVELSMSKIEAVFGDISGYQLKLLVDGVVVIGDTGAGLPEDLTDSFIIEIEYAVLPSVQEGNQTEAITINPQTLAEGTVWLFN